MPNTVAVAAALICQGGRFLIGQRPAHKAVQPGPHRQAEHEHHQREGVRPRQKAGGPAGQVPGEQGKPDIGLVE